MTKKPQQPALSLRELCLEIVTFRRHLLDRRANLASPGYHLDLDGAKAIATAEFLHTVPPLCSDLAGKITAYRLATGSDKFSAALESLQILHDKPQLVFSLQARTLHEHYFVSKELLEEISKADQEEADSFFGGEI
jgi:hypothetical protein